MGPQSPSHEDPRHPNLEFGSLPHTPPRPESSSTKAHVKNSLRRSRSIFDLIPFINTSLGSQPVQPTEEVSSPTTLGRRKSLRKIITDGFLDTLHRWDLADWETSYTKNAMQGKGTGTNSEKQETVGSRSPRKSSESEAPKTPTLSRRKSLGNLFGSISYKRKPRVGILRIYPGLDRLSQEFPPQNEECAQPEHLADENGHNLGLKPFNNKANNANVIPRPPPSTHISWCDNLPIADHSFSEPHFYANDQYDNEEAVASLVDTAECRNCLGSSTQDPYMEKVYETRYQPSQSVVSENMQPDPVRPKTNARRPRTPDSYLQLLIESHSDTSEIQIPSDHQPAIEDDMVPPKTVTSDHWPSGPFWDTIFGTTEPHTSPSQSEEPFNQRGTRIPNTPRNNGVEEEWVEYATFIGQDTEPEASKHNDIDPGFLQRSQSRTERYKKLEIHNEDSTSSLLASASKGKEKEAADSQYMWDRQIPPLYPLPKDLVQLEDKRILPSVAVGSTSSTKSVSTTQESIFSTNRSHHNSDSVFSSVDSGNALPPLPIQKSHVIIQDSMSNPLKDAGVNKHASEKQEKILQDSINPSQIILNDVLKSSSSNHRYHVQVSYPSTVGVIGHTELYESKEEAITAIFDTNAGEFDNICTFDPVIKMIFVHPRGRFIANAKEIKSNGLELLFIPTKQRYLEKLTSSTKHNEIQDENSTSWGAAEQRCKPPSNDASQKDELQLWNDLLHTSIIDHSYRLETEHSTASYLADFQKHMRSDLSKRNISPIDDDFWVEDTVNDAKTQIDRSEADNDTESQEMSNDGGAQELDGMRCGRLKFDSSMCMASTTELPDFQTPSGSELNFGSIPGTDEAARSTIDLALQSPLVDWDDDECPGDTDSEHAASHQQGSEAKKQQDVPPGTCRETDTPRRLMLSSEGGGAKELALRGCFNTSSEADPTFFQHGATQTNPVASGQRTLVTTIDIESSICEKHKPNIGATESLATLRKSLDDARDRLRQKRSQRESRARQKAVKKLVATQGNDHGKEIAVIDDAYQPTCPQDDSTVFQADTAQNDPSHSSLDKTTRLLVSEPLCKKDKKAAAQYTPSPGIRNRGNDIRGHLFNVQHFAHLSDEHEALEPTEICHDRRTSDGSFSSHASGFRFSEYCNELAMIAGNGVVEPREVHGSKKSFEDLSTLELCQAPVDRAITTDDLNIRFVGKAALQENSKQDRAMGALVGLFQSHGLMTECQPTFRTSPGLRNSPFGNHANQSQGRKPAMTSSSEELDTKTKRDAGIEKARAFKRAFSGLSDASTEASTGFGEPLESFPFTFRYRDTPK